MAGQIHGLIDREQAWEMWKPYGERAYDLLDNTFEGASLRPVDASNIFYAASEDARTTMEMDIFNEDPAFYTAMGEYLGDGDQAKKESTHTPPSQFMEWLKMQQLTQVELAREAKDLSGPQGGEFIQLLAKGALHLVKEQILKPAQLDKVMYWMTDNEGNPRVQYTPTTMLGAARRSEELDHAVPRPNFPPSFEAGEGIIIQPICIDLREYMDTNKVHEHVHAMFSGMEIYDITRNDGYRSPAATAVGIFMEQPTTTVDGSFDYAGCENGEANEGLTEYLAHVMMEGVPKLGIYYDEPRAYLDWKDKVAELNSNHRPLFEKLIDAMLVEATTQHPSAKRDALMDLREYADKILGKPDALTEYFIGDSVSLHEYHN